MWITTSPNLASWTMAGTMESFPLARGLDEVIKPFSVEARKKTSFPFAADMASRRRVMQHSEISSFRGFIGRALYGYRKGMSKGEKTAVKCSTTTKKSVHVHVQDPSCHDESLSICDI